MKIQSTPNNANGGELSNEEIKTLLASLTLDLEAVKEQDPKQYLILLRQMNKILKEMNVVSRRM